MLKNDELPVVWAPDSILLFCMRSLFDRWLQELGYGKSIFRFVNFVQKKKMDALFIYRFECKAKISVGTRTVSSQFSSVQLVQCE